MHAQCIMAKSRHQDHAGIACDPRNPGVAEVARLQASRRIRILANSATCQEDFSHTRHPPIRMTSRPHRMTVPEFVAQKAAGRKITVLTAYDHTMDGLVDACGIEAILVGDSLAMVVQGH